MLAATSNGTLGAVLGTVVFIVFIVAMLATFLDLFGSVHRWLAKITGRDLPSASVDEATRRMSEREFFDVTATKMMSDYHTGGKHVQGD